MLHRLLVKTFPELVAFPWTFYRVWQEDALTSSWAIHPFTEDAIAENTCHSRNITERTFWEADTTVDIGSRNRCYNSCHPDGWDWRYCPIWKCRPFGLFHRFGPHVPLQWWQWRNRWHYGLPPFMLRCLLVEAAWIAIRKDPAMTMAYNEYRKRMNPQKSIIKIARRLVNRGYFVLKHEKEYVPCVVQ